MKNKPEIRIRLTKYYSNTRHINSARKLNNIYKDEFFKLIYYKQNELVINRFRLQMLMGHLSFLSVSKSFS